MKNKKFRSIRVKLVFLLSLSAVITLLLSFLPTFAYTLNEKKNESVRSLSQLATILGENLAVTIEFGDTDTAKNMLKSLNQNENIIGAYVFDKNYTVFALYVNPKTNRTELDKSHSMMHETYDIKKIVKHVDFDRIMVNTPIFSSGEFIGSFSIFSDTKYINKTIKFALIVQLIVSIITLIIILLLAMKLQKIFTLPIFTLKEAMDDVSQNNTYDSQIQNKTNDEYQSLYDGFNNMITRIKNSTNELDIAKQEIEEIHKRTKDSIEYASLIQGALIPDNKQFRIHFQDFFAIWHPKDIVGGDIYLYEELRHDDECLLMVIDCTGHGVPGAFVTMLVKAIERQIVANIINSNEVVSPAKILSIFNRNMKNLLKQEDENSISNAGFDGGIIYYNKNDKIIKYAGSNTPLFYVEDDEIKTLKGSRHSIGYKKSDANFVFKEYTIDVKKGMQFYIATDGYFDQIGGEKEFPFGKKRFLNIIKEYNKESFADQQEIFLDKLQQYEDGYERNDDVTLIGFKI